MFSFCVAALGACSSNGDDGACSPTNIVDDTETASATQPLSASEQQAVAELIDVVLQQPRLAEVARSSWSDAPHSSGHALARDFVERVLIDNDSAAADTAIPDAARTEDPVHYTALRRVAVAGDLVLARSEGERDGSPRQLYDLFRVSEGRIVERWSADRPRLPAAGDTRTF